MKTLFRKLSTVYTASLTAVAVAWGLERVSGLMVGSVTNDLLLAFGFCAIYTGWKPYELWNEPRGSMICPKCGHDNPPDLIFCKARRRRLLVFVSYCAAILYTARVPCSNCNAEQPGNARYCGQCGIATGRGS